MAFYQDWMRNNRSEFYIAENKGNVCKSVEIFLVLQSSRKRAKEKAFGPFRSSPPNCPHLAPCPSKPFVSMYLSRCLWNVIIVPAATTTSSSFYIFTRYVWRNCSFSEGKCQGLVIASLHYVVWQMLMCHAAPDTRHWTQSRVVPDTLPLQPKTRLGISFYFNGIF